jgi:hypothetical protein
MFAKLAQIRLRAVGSVQRALVTKDSRAAFRPTVHPYRAPRPILVCRWHQAPASGALECIWEAVGAPPTRELRPERELGEVHRLTDARAATRRPFGRAA